MLVAQLVDLGWLGMTWGKWIRLGSPSPFSRFSPWFLIVALLCFPITRSKGSSHLENILRQLRWLLEIVLRMSWVSKGQSRKKWLLTLCILFMQLVTLFQERVGISCMIVCDCVCTQFLKQNHDLASWAFNFEALNVPCSYGRESQTTGRWLNNQSTKMTNWDIQYELIEFSRYMKCTLYKIIIRFGSLMLFILPAEPLQIQSAKFINWTERRSMLSFPCSSSSKPLVFGFPWSAKIWGANGEAFLVCSQVGPRNSDWPTFQSFWIVAITFKGSVHPVSVSPFHRSLLPCPHGPYLVASLWSTHVCPTCPPWSIALRATMEILVSDFNIFQPTIPQRHGFHNPTKRQTNINTSTIR